MKRISYKSRFIAIICMVTLILSTFITTSSATSNEYLKQFSIYEIQAGLVPGVSKNSISNKIQSNSANDIVCVMRIYADPSGEDSSSSPGHSFGHAFLTFLNCSQNNIKVGRFYVAPGQMISVGKFGNFGTAANNFKGVFYNVETQRKEKLNWYTRSESMYVELTQTQLDSASAYIINNQSGYLEIGNNCATLAAGAWNAALSSNHVQYIPSFSTPDMIKGWVEEYGYYYTGNGLLRADYSRCYYSGSTLIYCGDPHLP